MKCARFFSAAAICLFLGGTLSAAELSITEEQRQEEAKSSAAPSNEADFAKNLQAALQNGSLEDALALFDGIPASLASNADLQKLRASLLISAGRHADAQKLLADLEQKNSGDIEIKEMKMILAKASGNAGAKSAAIKEIIAIDPTNPSANIALGEE